jgi:hypothetical protein
MQWMQTLFQGFIISLGVRIGRGTYGMLELPFALDKELTRWR